jgi:hypothetical protein
LEAEGEMWNGTQTTDRVSIEDRLTLERKCLKHKRQEERWNDIAVLAETKCLSDNEITRLDSRVIM